MIALANFLTPHHIGDQEFYLKCDLILTILSRFKKRF